MDVLHRRSSAGLLNLIVAGHLLAACGSDETSANPDSGAGDAASPDASDPTTDAGDSGETPDGGPGDGGTPDGVTPDASNPDVADGDTSPNPDGGPTDVAPDADTDVADDVADGSGSDLPAATDCTVIELSPATFAVGDTAEMDVTLFCPEGARSDRKTNFAILLGGSSGNRCGDDVEEPVDGGTVLRTRRCWPDVDFTRDTIGRLDLEIIGAPGTEPLVRTVGVSENLATLEALGSAPAGLELGGPVDVYTVGPATAGGVDLALVVDRTGFASIFGAGPSGAFSGSPRTRVELGFWNFDDAAGSDSSGLIVPVGGVVDSAPMAAVGIAGCGSADGALVCGIQPVQDGDFGDPIVLRTTERGFVDKVLSVISAAPETAAAGEWGGLVALTVVSPAISLTVIRLSYTDESGIRSQSVNLAPEVVSALATGTAQAQLVRTGSTPTEGPGRPEDTEIWIHTPDARGGGLLQAWAFNPTGELVLRLERSVSPAWNTFSVASVRLSSGKISHVVTAETDSGRSLLYFPRTGGVADSPILLTLPGALGQGGSFSDSGLGPDFAHVRDDVATSTTIRATLSVNYQNSNAPLLLGGADVAWTVPLDTSGVFEIEGDALAFALPQRSLEGRRDSGVPFASVVLDGESMPLLGVSPGNGFLDIGRNPPEWKCEDECLERVGGGLCGNTGHFITVLVGEVDGTMTFAAERDREAARPLDMPPGSELRGVPTGCWVDDADGVWVAAPVGRAGSPDETTTLRVWRLGASESGPVSGYGLSLPEAVRDAQLLAVNPTGDATEGVFLTRALDSDEWTASTVSFNTLQARLASPPRTLGVAEVLSTPATKRFLADTNQWLPLPVVPGQVRTRAVEPGAQPEAWYWLMDDPGVDGGCARKVEGGDVVFSDSASVSLRDGGGLLCGSTSHFLTVGDFGDGVGPVTVRAAEGELDARLAVLVNGLDGPAWVETPVPFWNNLSLEGGLLPRVIPGDFNGDGLTDLWLEPLDGGEPGVLFADGNGGWTTDALVVIPALLDLQAAIGEGIFYGSEGLRVTSLRRARGSSAE